MLENLYSIIERDEQEVKVKLGEKDHSLFRAHFPGNPILPGFMQIEIIANILEDDIVAIGYSKFLSHILPGDIIVYRIENENKKRRIKILRDSKKVSEMTYESK